MAAQLRYLLGDATAVEAEHQAAALAASMGVDKRLASTRLS